MKRYAIGIALAAGIVALSAVTTPSQTTGDEVWRLTAVSKRPWAFQATDTNGNTGVAIVADLKSSTGKCLQSRIEAVDRGYAVEARSNPSGDDNVCNTRAFRQFHVKSSGTIKLYVSGS